MAQNDWGTFLLATLQAFLDAGDEGVLVFDQGGACRMVGRRIGEMFAVEPARLVGSTREETLRALAGCAAEPAIFYEAIAADDMAWPAQSLGEHELRTPQKRTIVWSSYPIQVDERGVGRLCLVRDVTAVRASERARAQLEKRLEAAAPVDAVTGMANKTRFLESLEREHARASRAWDSYAILLIDVDDLAAINRRVSAEAGDAALAAVAELLRSGLRGYDIAARIAEDTFGLVIPAADRVAVEAVGERVLYAARERQVPGVGQMTVSAGAAVWLPTASKEPSTSVLDRAMAALETARRKGPSCLVVESSARTIPPEAVPLEEEDTFVRKPG